MLKQPELGQKLRAIRIRQRWSMRELADAAGVSHNVVYGIESGKTGNSRIRTWEKICAVLRVKMSYFEK